MGFKNNLECRVPTPLRPRTKRSGRVRPVIGWCRILVHGTTHSRTSNYNHAVHCTYRVSTLYISWYLPSRHESNKSKQFLTGSISFTFENQETVSLQKYNVDEAIKLISRQPSSFQ